jgi:hypothetical protein
MESLEIKLDSDAIDKVGEVAVLRDTCLLAIASQGTGFKVERLNVSRGIPRNIIIMDTTGKKTKEDIINYAKIYLDWYKFS